MKIGINASFLRKPGTGIGQVTVNFLEKLTEFSISNFQFSNKKNIEFILYCEEEPKLDFVLPENFQVRVFLPWWKRDDILRKVLWEKQVAQEAVKDDCDVFLSLYQSSTIFQDSKVLKHVMMVHDIIPKLFPEYQGNVRQKHYWKAVEQGICGADQIVAISENTKKDLVRELGIAEEKITVVPIDVNPRFRETVTSDSVAIVLNKYDLQSGYIYHGGGLEIRKNTETLLRAYKRLTENKEQTINNKKIPKLVISGKIFDVSNKLATDVAELVVELRLENSVRLLGFVPDEDLPALYASALFFVYPSLYEGFGLPVLEALCTHTPVLSSNTSALPEVGGEAVLYTDPENVEEMAQKMEQLISDETLRHSLTFQSTQQALQFSWEKCTEKILAIVTR